MARGPMILLGLIGELLLQCQGIALRVEPASDCMDAVPGDSCHNLVKWTLDQGLVQHPEWFPSFERSYSEELDFKHVQGILSSRKKAGCGRPCLAEPDTASPPDAEEAAPAAPAAEEATRGAEPADAPEPAAQEERPRRSNLIGRLEGELKALDAMMDSPDLETLRTEKRQLIQNLRAADKMEAELEAHKLQNQRTVEKIEGELERLEAMEDSPAMELLRGEKSKQIDEVRAADKSETELKTREIQRLQDPVAAAREVAATTAPAAAAPAAAAAAKEVLKPEGRTNLLRKLDAELKAMDHMKDSPAMETLRAEKHQLIQNLQGANKLEAELKAGQLQNQQTLAKMKAVLKTLEEMKDSPALQALRKEKRTQIQNLQEADKTETELKVRELRRLQDPAETAKDTAPAAPAAEKAKPEAPAAGRKPWWKKWHNARAKEEATTEEATAVVDSQSEATPEQHTAPAASSQEAEPAEAPVAAAEADPEVALAPPAADEATPEAALAAEEAKPADAATPAEAPAAAAEEPTLRAAMAASTEDTKLAAPAAQEECRDAAPGDRCYTMVNWALEKGVKKHDQWFLGQTSDELSFKAIQGILYKKGKGGCGKPCPAATSSPAPEVQIVLTRDGATSTEAPAAAAEEAKTEAAPAAEGAKPAGAATPAKAGEATPQVVLAPPAAEEATPQAAPAAEEAEPPAAEVQAPTDDGLEAAQSAAGAEVQSATEAGDQEEEQEEEEENNETKTTLEPMTSKSLSEMSPEELQTYLGDPGELDKYAYYLSHTSRRKRWEDEVKRQHKIQDTAQ